MNTNIYSQELVAQLKDSLMLIISETNGISLMDTLELALHSYYFQKNNEVKRQIEEFINLITAFQENKIHVESLLAHPLGLALREYFKAFPLKYKESHIHLTGSLDASFVYPRIIELLENDKSGVVKRRIIETYGEGSLPICSAADVDKLLRLEQPASQSFSDNKSIIENINPQFERYLEILMLPKLILTSRQAHEDAAYHMANKLYHESNVGSLALKFTMSRKSDSEKVPGVEDLGAEDVILGLFQGFKLFQDAYPDFSFTLSPSFRKEADFYDTSKYSSKAEDFNAQVNELIAIIQRYPELKKYVTEVDTVGNEKEMYRKSHFAVMEHGLKRLQNHGFDICSHHGENFHTLRLGVQAVDNALNIWRINKLEHGLSLGINPNFYFHRLFERVLSYNRRSKPLPEGSVELKEVVDMDWQTYEDILEKLKLGNKLTNDEIARFAKIKFYTAREVEYYQHDVLNRMITKNVQLTALPSSNTKLTGRLVDYKDHPFSWWEKKGVSQSVGTDNYVTLSTDIIREMMILLFSDAKNLKITKLLMVVTGESRRPYLSQLLWDIRTRL